MKIPDNLKNITLLVFSVLLLNVSAGTSAQDYSDTQIQTSPYSQAELDQMLAPIALYPDSVLSHILIASTYPLEIVLADRWARDHEDLEGEAAINAADDEDWDPSVKALVAFPHLLERLSDDLDWTEQLGEAFLASEEQVLDTVQNLRQRAIAEGSLNDMEHIAVVQEEDDIVIEPAVREVVYVPFYDTRVVYGPWWWSGFPPVYWDYPHHVYHTHRPYHYNSVVYWGPRVSISWGFFFSSVSWHHHHVVVIDRHRYPNHRFYSGRYVARHHDAERWTHNPHHRRGVTYRNPRTRDYFDKQPHKQNRYDDRRQYTGTRTADRDARQRETRLSSEPRNFIKIN